MKRKNLKYAFALLCLISVLAACARGNAPADAPTQSEEPAQTAAPVSDETYAECRRLVSNSLEQNKSALPLYEILSLDREVFFADYTGGGFQVVRFERARTENDPLLSSTYKTNDAYFWYDRSGEATPEQAAGELVRVMLEDLKSQPEFGRTFTITEYSVKEQTLYGWENLPELVLAVSPYNDIDGLSHDEAVKKVREQLSRQREMAVSQIGLAFALGEDMWALDPYFTFDYTGVVNGFRREVMEIWGLTADGDGLFAENQRGTADKCAHILMRDGNVWRMQRAEAMERMFADTVRIERMGGYTLSQLEHSMIEGGREYYIEGAAGEYLRRLKSDPEGTYAHMDELGFPRLAWLCDQLSYVANSDGFTPKGDSYSAGLLGKYMAFHSREKAPGERPLPPAAGVLCPALLYDGIRVRADMGPLLNYVDDRLLIFSDWSGVYAYDFEKEEIVFTADLLTAMGSEATHGSRASGALVDADGGRIRLAYREDSWDHYLVRYEIDTGDWSWEFVEYELPNEEREKLFSYDADDAGQGRIELKTLKGTNATNLLRDLVYIRGDEEIRLFDNISFGGTAKVTPVPSADLEHSIHNALICRYDLPGGFQCEAHETLSARPDGAGNTVCYLAFQREAFSLAGGEPLSSSFIRGYAALTFRNDGSGRYMLTDFVEPDKGPLEEIAGIFPGDLLSIARAPETEQALEQSCISQAMEHFGLAVQT